MAVRQIVPRGVDAMDLHWTYLGYADDTPEMRARRLQQLQPGRPGRLRFDGGRLRRRLRQRGTAAADERGVGAWKWAAPAPKAQKPARPRRAVRGFWKEWRAAMGSEP